MAVRRHVRKLRTVPADEYPAPSPLVIFDKLNAAGHPPPARTSHSADIHDGIMYIFGGQVAGQRVSRVDALDIKHAKWMNVSCGGETPIARAGHASACFEATIIVHGGEGTRALEGTNPSTSHQTYLLEDCHALDLHSLQWIKMRQSLAPSPRKDHTAVCMMRKTENGPKPHFVVFGGLLGGDLGVTNEIHCLELSSTNTQANSWTAVVAKGSMPCPRRAHAAVAVPAAVVARRGSSKGAFDLTVTLATGANESTKRAVGELMFVFGGLSPTGTASRHFELMGKTKGQAAAASAAHATLRSVHSDTTILGDLCVYDGMQNAWRHLSHQATGTPPQARFGHSMTFVPGRDRRRTPHVLLCGGATWTQNMFAGDHDEGVALLAGGAADTLALDAGAAAGWRRQALGDVFMLDLTTLTWNAVDLGFIPFPARLNHSCVVHTSPASEVHRGRELAAATAKATRLLPRSKDPTQRSQPARVQLLVFGGMGAKLCDATVWRGRLRRRRGQFFSFTDVVSQAVAGAPGAQAKTAAEPRELGQRIPVPEPSALRLDPDIQAGVDAVYDSDGDADSDGISTADAERLVSRAKEVAAAQAALGTTRRPDLLTARFVVGDSDEDESLAGTQGRARAESVNPASPTKLKSPKRAGTFPPLHAVGATNVFADIVASAGQEMAEAVQQRLMALQKRVIELHGTLDREMAARKHAQQHATELQTKLDRTSKELVDTVTTHEQTLFDVQSDAARRVAAAEDAAAQAASDLKRVTNAAYLLQTAAEHRIEHLERVVAELQQAERARGGAVRVYTPGPEETQEQAKMYADILHDTEAEIDAAQLGGGEHDMSTHREAAVSAPSLPPPMPSVAPLARSTQRTHKPRLLAPAANV